MAYALYDFFDSIEVGKTDWIQCKEGAVNVEDVIKTGGTVCVLWQDPRRGRNKQTKDKLYEAKVITVSDNRKELCSLAAEIENGKKSIEDVKSNDVPSVKGRGQRTKFASKRVKECSSESEVEDSDTNKDSKHQVNKVRKTMKSAAAAEILKRIRERNQTQAACAEHDEEQQARDKETVVVGDMRRIPSGKHSASTGTVRVHDETNENLEAEVKSLTSENEQLRNALTALSYLPQLVTALQNSSFTCNPPPQLMQLQQKVSTGGVQCQTPTTVETTPSSAQLDRSRIAKRSLQAQHTPVTSMQSSSSVVPSRSSASASPVIPAPSPASSVSTVTNEVLVISDSIVQKCNRASAQKFVNDLLSAVYTEEYLATHSLGGKSSKESTKQGIPQDNVQLVIDVVKQAFPAEDSSHIRGYLRQKLNNADKVLKRKVFKDIEQNSVGLGQPTVPSPTDRVQSTEDA